MSTEDTERVEKIRFRVEGIEKLCQYLNVSPLMGRENLDDMLFLLKLLTEEEKL